MFYVIKMTNGNSVRYLEPETTEHPWVKNYFGCDIAKAKVFSSRIDAYREVIKHKIVGWRIEVMAISRELATKMA